MAQVYLLSTRQDATDLPRMQVAAERDRVRQHWLTGRPEDADLILFTDPAVPDMADIRQHPLYRQHASRCFVMATGDRVLPFVPGLFACPEKTTHPVHRSRTGPYLRVAFEPPAPDEAEGLHPSEPAEELLFSFVGRTETAAVRERIARLRHPRGVVIDACLPDRGLAPAAFRRLLARSRFVLCPRGYGSSSFRLFETLRAGRVPVIVSDEWIPCSGPDWPSFSLMVREDKISSLPALLEKAETQYAQMQQAARRAWAEWFATDVVFHRTVEWCLDLARHQPASRRWDDRHYRLGRWRPSMLRWQWAGRHWRRRLRAAA
ncbi:MULTISPECIES: exostosin domain-containing protein [Aphanothece]|uniref:exostosin domain-containing protein n=1 Tax=Aphanothece TaxID=1121 RepID=UPI00398504C4